MNTPALDPVFRTDAPTQLTVAADTPDAALADWLAFQVAAQPTDLIGHVRRIEYERRHGDGMAVAAALTDLLLALGAKGTSLKRRMRGRCARTLARHGMNPSPSTAYADAAALCGQVRLLHRATVAKGLSQ